MAEQNTQGCQITVVQFGQDIPCNGVLLKYFPIAIEAETFQPCRDAIIHHDSLSLNRCAPDMEYVLLAAGDMLIDNIAMTNGASPAKTGHRTIIRHIEHRLISIGMSVIAYLLERAVLRSIKRGKTES